MNWRRLRQFVIWALALAVVSIGVLSCAARQAGEQGDASMAGASTASAVGAKAITGIEITGDATGSQVAIYGNQNLEYAAMKSPFANGIVLYFAGASLADIPAEYAPDDPLVSRVTAAQSQGTPPATRVEITLKKDVPFAVNQSADTVLVDLSGPEAVAGEPAASDGEATGSSVIPVAAAKTDTQAEAEEARTRIQDLLRSKAAATPAASGTAAASADGSSPRVKQIDFIQRQKGKSSVRIETTAPVDYRTTKLSEKRVLVEMPGVTISKVQQRPLITTRFESAVDRILPLQKDSETAAVSVELREAVPYRVQQEGSTIVMHFEPSVIPPRPPMEAGLTDWQVAMTEAVEVAPGGAAEEKSEVKTVLDSLGLDNQGRMGDGEEYVGQKITLDFQKADIKNVFRILKEVSGLNFAIDKDVQGEVTLTMTEPVPWDQLLQLVLKMNGLGAIRMGNIIRIAPQATLDADAKSETERIESERKKKEAQRQAEEAKKARLPQRLEYIPVNYADCAKLAEKLANIKVVQGIESAAAAKSAKPNLSELFGGGAPNITAANAEAVGTSKFKNLSCDERTNTIIIIDNDLNINDAKKMVAQLDRPTPQVMIEARIVEATATFSREIGVNWSGDAGIQPGDARTGVGPQRGYDSLGGTYGYNWKVNHPSLNVAQDNLLGFNFSRIQGLTPLTLDATLAAMETRGSLKIVSAPKILTLDNKMASIKQGIEYPITKLDEAGNTNVEYKDVDLLLEVTPHITRDRRVSMKIKTTKNDIGQTIGSEVSFTTKEAETELLVNDGDTVVIGGIIKSTKRDDLDGVPGLMRVPVLGWLFKYQNVQDEREELLVFITPRIVDLDTRQ